TLLTRCWRSGCAGTHVQVTLICRRCGGRCRVQNRSNRRTSRTSARPERRSGCVPRRSCPPSGWPKRQWQCRFRNVAGGAGGMGSLGDGGVGVWVDEGAADMLSVRRGAVPATTGNTRRLASLGPVLNGVQARIVDEDGVVQPTRGVGLIEVRGDSVTSGYVT